jgi:hypothetical protein
MTEWMEHAWLGKGWQHNFHTHPESAYLECVIVEPRPHPWLGGVLRNVSCILPNARMTVVYDVRHHDFVEDCVEHSARVRRIPLHCSAPPTVMDYNAWMLSEWFWDLFEDASRVLLFQTDTGVRKNRVLRYLEYPYIGAPWGGAPPPLQNTPHDWVVVGNGGLSLRDPRVMRDVCRRFPAPCDVFVPEDVHFSRHVASMDALPWPDKDVARTFSMEHVRCDDPMGFHQIYHWHPRNSVLDPLLDGCDPTFTCHEIAEVTDAWIESREGYVATSPDLLAWLRVGIGPCGLVIPKGSRIPLDEPDGWGGHCKELCWTWKNKAGDSRTERIPLQRMRVAHEVCVGHTTPNIAPPLRP